MPRVQCGGLKTLRCLPFLGVVFLMLSGCGAAADKGAQQNSPAPTGIESAPEILPSPTAPASDPKLGASERGDFDFYVLSLSWSPTYCLDEGERADPAQCGARRPLGFVVHGLWPQHEKGYPEDCGSENSPRLSAQIIDSMLDVMPSRQLIKHEWRAHGLCAGLSAKDYFAAMRNARAAIRLPQDFAAPDTAISTSPGALESAFIKENKGLNKSGIAVTCSGRRLREVRLCLTKSLAFRTCNEVDRRSCQRDDITAPAWRGG